MKENPVFMMTVVCFSVFLVQPVLAGFSPDLYERAVIRERFHECIDSASAVNELVKELDERRDQIAGRMPDHVFVYYAALKGLQAKYGKNLLKKLEDLKASLTMLDEAVARAPEDLEVRFIRFSSLHHFPNLLGIGKKRGQDLNHIVTGLKKQDDSIVDQKTQNEMIRFLQESDRLSKEQTAEMEFLLR